METDFLKELNIELSEEEQKNLDEINKKISEALNDKQKEIMDQNKDKIDDIMRDPNALYDDPIHSKHITNYDREILVDIKMEISSTNKDGQLTEIAPILQNYYHIPVPSGSNYVDTIEKFSLILEENLANCAKKIFLKNEPTEVHI
jgi:hypothetical protein